MKQTFGSSLKSIVVLWLRACFFYVYSGKKILSKLSLGPKKKELLLAFDTCAFKTWGKYNGMGLAHTLSAIQCSTNWKNLKRFSLHYTTIKNCPKVPCCYQPTYCFCTALSILAKVLRRYQKSSYIFEVAEKSMCESVCWQLCFQYYAVFDDIRIQFETITFWLGLGF